jgi:hypothetical protein
VRWSNILKGVRLLVEFAIAYALIVRATAWAIKVIAETQKNADN